MKKDNVRLASDRSHYGNIPFRGDFPLYNRDEPRENKPEVVVDVDTQVLDMTEEDEVKEYNRICELVANGEGKFGYCDHQWIESEETWKVLITYQQWFKETPENARQTRNNIRTKN